MAEVGRGRVLVGDDLELLLAAAHVAPEPMAARGLGFIRRRHEGATHYFIANQGAEGNSYLPFQVDGDDRVEQFQRAQGVVAAAVADDRQGEGIRVPYNASLPAGERSLVSVPPSGQLCLLLLLSLPDSGPRGIRGARSMEAAGVLTGLLASG